MEWLLVFVVAIIVVMALILASRRRSEPVFLIYLRDEAGQEHPVQWSRLIAWADRSPGWCVAACEDCETTGVGPEDELIELALILFYYDRTTGEVHGIADYYCGFQESTVPINPFARRKHQINPDMLSGKKLDAARVESILNRAEFLIAHKASFDRRFVARLIPKAQTKRWLCSMSQIDWKSHGMEARKLEDLLPAHKIDLELSHRALPDAKATLLLLQQCRPDGTRYLAELLGRA